MVVAYPREIHRERQEEEEIKKKVPVEEHVDVEEEKEKVLRIFALKCPRPLVRSRHILRIELTLGGDGRRGSRRAGFLCDFTRA